MLIFREFFKTQSDQNIHQNAPNCTTFSNFHRAASICPWTPRNLRATIINMYFYMNF